MERQDDFIYEPFFYYFICHTCKSLQRSVKACTGCKLVSYCCRDHQKMHWPQHKEFCKCIQAVVKSWKFQHILGYHDKSTDAWKTVRVKMIYLVEKYLNRNLKIDERQMFFFPNVCKVCYSADTKPEFNCDNCNSSYCSENHKTLDLNRHNLLCDEIRMCFILDIKCFTNSIDPNELQEYYEFPFLFYINFPEDIRSFFSLYSNVENISFRIATEYISGSLTLAFSMVSSNILSLKEPKSLNVHVIGSASYEQNFIQTIELLFHIFASLERLSITLIGPDTVNKKYEPTLCTICAEKDLSIAINDQLYHSYITSDQYEKPDIIIAFNCGFCEHAGSQLDTWEASIESIIGLKNILFVFTSYTRQESIKDYGIVRKIALNKENLNFNKVHIENPFRSLKPFRDWERIENELYYTNNYLTSVEIL